MKIRSPRLLKLGFLTICLLLIGYFLSSNAYATNSLYTNSFVSDYVNVLMRYSLYCQGKISLWTAFTIKQINHNHFFIYFLSFLDIKFFHGSKILLVAATAISNLAVAIIVIGVLGQAKELTVAEKAALGAFTFAEIYTFSSGEIWLYPFQAVLSTFRLFLVLAILLFCLSINQSLSWRKVFLLMSMSVVISLASISHGGGLIFLPILLFFSLILKQKIQSIVMILLLGLLAVYELNSPSQGLSSVEIIFRSLQNLGLLIDRTLYVLGYYLGLPKVIEGHVFSFIVGLFGLVFYSYSAARAIKQWVRGQSVSFVYLFFVIWAGFSLLGTAMSVMTNIGYAEIRNARMTHAYFLSSRYAVTVSGFWISLIPLAVIASKTAELKVLKINFSRFVNPLLVSLSLLVWLNGMSMLPIWKSVYQDFVNGEVAARSSALTHLPADEATRLIGLPSGSYASVKELVGIQETYRIGPYASVEVETLEKTAKFNRDYIGIVHSADKIDSEIYRVRGTLQLNKNHYTQVSARPAPLVNQSGTVVGVAVIEGIPHFRYDTNVKELPFFGYTKYRNIEELQAIFPKRNTSILEDTVRSLDRISQNTALLPQTIATRIACSVRALTNNSSAIQAEKFSDVNWSNGISKGSAGFFTKDICKIIDLHAGDSLKFKTSGFRKVLRVTGDQVWVDGSSLSPEGDGYPHEIYVGNPKD